jgi:hypothetical protein
MNALLMVDPLIALTAACCIAALLLHAAWAKLGDRDLFHQHLAAYGTPEALQPALVWALPLVEAAAALGLVTPWRGLAALAAAGLLALYGAAMAWHLAHGRVLDCGCGGEPLRLSIALVLRNAVLVLIALVAALPTEPRALGLADGAVAAAAVALSALLLAAFNQLLRQQPAGAASSSNTPPAGDRSPA